MRVQRLRVTFAKSRELRFITHLDLMRFWERALRRAAIPVAYSEGFSPHAQISLAAPLPVGVSGIAELMDVFLAERMTPKAFLKLAATQLPPGLTVHSAREIDLQLPSLQSLMRAAEYRAALPGDADAQDMARRVEALLAQTSLPWQHVREKEVRSYDLRPLIQSIRIDNSQPPAALVLTLQADNVATGRPDQVLLALGLPAGLALERTALVLARASHRRRPPVAALPEPTAAR
jgi:radical SAM-linked protein